MRAPPANLALVVDSVVRNFQPIGNRSVSVYFVEEGMLNTGMSRVPVSEFLTQRSGLYATPAIERGYLVLDGNHRGCLQITSQEDPLRIMDPRLQERLNVMRSYDLSGDINKIGGDISFYF